MLTHRDSFYNSKRILDRSIIERKHAMEGVHEKLDLRSMRAVSKATVSQPQIKKGVTITHIPAKHAKAI